MPSDGIDAALAAAKARAERAEAELARRHYNGCDSESGGKCNCGLPFLRALEERDALRAHVERLAAALREVAQSPQPVCAQGHGTACDCAGDAVRATLAALPADSGREWEAMRRVCEAAGRKQHTLQRKTDLRAALTALDAARKRET